jgi:aspartate oxidase
MRKESRGLHYTLDFPEPVDAEKKPSLLADGDLQSPIARRPMTSAPR